jgi:TPP-dependent pyruvate/acetoin dehydrogenase alpha subunit
MKINLKQRKQNHKQKQNTKTKINQQKGHNEILKIYQNIKRSSTIDIFHHLARQGCFADGLLAHEGEEATAMGQNGGETAHYRRVSATKERRKTILAE